MRKSRLLERVTALSALALLALLLLSTAASAQTHGTIGEGSTVEVDGDVYVELTKVEPLENDVDETVAEIPCPGGVSKEGSYTVGEKTQKSIMLDSDKAPFGLQTEDVETAVEGLYGGDWQPEKTFTRTFEAEQGRMAKLIAQKERYMVVQGYVKNQDGIIGEFKLVYADDVDWFVSRAACVNPGGTLTETPGPTPTSTPTPSPTPELTTEFDAEPSTGGDLEGTDQLTYEWGFGTAADENGTTGKSFNFTSSPLVDYAPAPLVERVKGETVDLRIEAPSGASGDAVSNEDGVGTSGVSIGVKVTRDGELGEIRKGGYDDPSLRVTTDANTLRSIAGSGGGVAGKRTAIETAIETGAIDIEANGGVAERATFEAGTRAARAAARLAGKEMPYDCDEGETRRVTWRGRETTLRGNPLGHRVLESREPSERDSGIQVAIDEAGNPQGVTTTATQKLISAGGVAGLSENAGVYSAGSLAGGAAFDLTAAGFPTDVIACQTCPKGATDVKWNVVPTIKGHEPGDIEELEDFHTVVSIANTLLNGNPVSPTGYGEVELFKKLAQRDSGGITFWLVVEVAKCEENMCGYFSWERTWVVKDRKYIKLGSVTFQKGLNYDSESGEYTIKENGRDSIRTSKNKLLFEEYTPTGGDEMATGEDMASKWKESKDSGEIKPVPDGYEVVDDK